MNQPVYKNITAAVRPPRCAILINEDSKHWKAAASGAISCASGVWGGKHFLMIPTNGSRIKPKFWELLEAYSPDHIAEYVLSFADLQVSQPEVYETTRQRYREDWESKKYGDGFEKHFEDRAARSKVDEMTISDELQKELIARLSPFHFNEKAVNEHLWHRSGFGYPFTQVSKVISETTRHIGQLVWPKKIDDPTLALLTHAQTGIADEKYRKAFEEEHFLGEELPDEYQNRDYLSHIFGGSSAIGSGFTVSWSPSEEYMPKTPFGLSMLHLAQYYRADTHMAHKEPVTIVVGDSVDDFCLFYSLSRIHDGAILLPLSWLRSCNSALASYHRRRQAGEEVELQLTPTQSAAQQLLNIAFELVDYGHHDKNINLASMSLSKRQISAYKKQMVDCCYFEADRFADCASYVPIENLSTQCVSSVFEENNYKNHRRVVFVDGETVSPFETPIPKNFHTIKLPHHYWLTSLTVDGYQPPPLSTLGLKIINMHGVENESRVANDGIVYQCPSPMYFGGDVDTNTVRPRIKTPDSMAIFSDYFDSIGVKIAYSDKGNYLDDALQRFGGLEAAAKFIKSASTRSILDKFLTKESLKGGSIVYLQNDQRAYLSFEGIATSVGDQEQAAELIDELVNKHVLERGYIFGCDRCRLSSWYSLDVLTTEFKCGRCSFRQQFTRRHWKQPFEAHWYYRLAETIYQFYLHNSDLTVQALYKLKTESKYAFHYVPEINLLGFPRTGKKKELDIACIVDGKIILGEAKSGRASQALSPDDVLKFEQLNARLGKRPDSVVFASSQRAVSDVFNARINSLPGARVLFFDDLYDS